MTYTETGLMIRFMAVSTWPKEICNQFEDFEKENKYPVHETMCSRP